MWSVVIGALAARRGQAAVVTLVAMLATAAAAAAGWYAAAATSSVSVATVQVAPPEQRLVTVTGEASTVDGFPAVGGGPGLGDHPAEPFRPLGFRVVAGGHVTADLTAPDEPAGRPVILSHRDNACDHLAVTGRCPAAPHEVLVPEELAAVVGRDGPARLAVAGTEPHQVQVVGSYRVVDPFDPYWAGRLLAGAGGPGPARQVVFAPAGAEPLAAGWSTYDLLVEPDVFGTVDIDTVAAAVHRGTADLTRRGYEVSSDLPALVDRVAAEQRTVATSVASSVVLLLVLTLFALAVVFRAAADQTRRDTAWWLLRGAPAGHRWLAALAPAGVALLVGSGWGTVAGVAVGQSLTGATGAVATTGWRWTAVLVGATVAAALLLAVVIHAATLRTPVRELLRRVPARHTWQRRAADVVAVVLVAAVAVQALWYGEATGVALLAPGLIGLGAALVASWALARAGARVARQALRGGRLTTALTALSIARRAGARRLFALATAAVALLTVALVGSDTLARSQWQRAAVEVGAGQVVTVTATDPGRLLAAVRAADPDGAEAMAVVRTAAGTGSPPVLALDTTRLAVVEGWRDGYGGTPAQVAAALRPPVAAPAMIAADRLQVEAAGADPTGAQVHLRVLLRVAGTGEPVAAEVGPLAPEPATHPVRVPECVTGCRLVGVEVLGLATVSGHVNASPGSRVELHRLSDHRGAELVGVALLGDPGRWRPAVGEWERGPAIATDGAALRVSIAAHDAAPGESGPVLLMRDDRALLLDAPVPLPAVIAGWRPPPATAAEPRLAVLGGSPVPVQARLPAQLLPGLGGRGALVDLEYALLTDVSGGAGTTAQVWLAPTAGAAVLDRLRAAGLEPVRHESLESHAGRLAVDGATAGARFQVAVALVVLLLAAGAVLTRFTGQSADRAAERVALRGQGIAARTVRVLDYGVPAALVAAAVVVGVSAGLVGVALARLRPPGLADAGALLAMPAPHPYPVALAAVAGAAVLGGAAAAAAVMAGRKRAGAP